MSLLGERALDICRLMYDFAQFRAQGLGEVGVPLNPEAYTPNHFSSQFSAFVNGRLRSKTN